jgi:hypothetical protein
MFKVERIEIRPSIDVPWFDPDSMLDPQHFAYFIDTYFNYENIISRDGPEISEDGLTSVTAIYWISEDHYQQFKLDPIIIEYITLPRLKYNKSVNIIQTKRETNLQV